MTDERDRSLPAGARDLTAEELDAFGPRLHSDEGMRDFLTATFGHAGGFFVIRRGGDWRVIVLADEVLQ